MPDLYARPVDTHRGRAVKITVTAAEFAAVDVLPGGLRWTHDGRLTCGPLSGEAVLVAHGRFYVRRASCGLPSCCCALQFWGVRRRKPVPPPDWAHHEHENDEYRIVGCDCGRIDDLDRYWPSEARS